MQVNPEKIICQAVGKDRSMDTFRVSKGSFSADSESSGSATLDWVVTKGKLASLRMAMKYSLVLCLVRKAQLFNMPVA